MLTFPSSFSDNVRMIPTGPHSERMKPIQFMSPETARSVRWILTDIDDTMTMQGKLVPEAYTTLCNLKKSGFIVIAVTGRSAGWGEVHLQEWPIDGVITENGAVSYYRTEPGEGTQSNIDTLVHPSAVRNTAPALRCAAEEALRRFPRAKPAGDNHFRLYDYAIDHAEYVQPPLSAAEVEGIVDIFQAAGCMAKPSSIHINCWIGSFNKKETTVAFLEKYCNYRDAIDREKVIYIGDALNDEVMFAHFPNACAVANIDIWLKQMTQYPAWVSNGRYGIGFAEIGRHILTARLTQEPNQPVP